MTQEHKRQDGFTILELLIATTVFGVMMLLATAGMISIGRTYYKGIISSKTQEIARSIEQEIGDTARNGSENAIRNSDSAPFIKNDDALSYDIKAFCIGRARYSYVLNTKASGDNVTTGTKTIKHVLWYDLLTSASERCVPADITLDNPSSTPNTPGVWENKVDSSSAEVRAQQRDLLANNMRLTQFKVSSNESNSGINIELRVMYGDDDVIDLTASPNICKSNIFGGQFCAAAELSSFVEKR